MAAQAPCQFFACGDKVQSRWDDGEWYKVLRRPPTRPTSPQPRGPLRRQRPIRLCTPASLRRPAPTSPPQGVISDRLGQESYCIFYEDGAFEESVPASDIRLLNSFAPPMLKQNRALGQKRKNELLRDAANAGDAAAVLRLMQEGASASYVDSQGFTPLHWAAGPEDSMPGDTKGRRQCIELLARVSEIDAGDSTALSMRAVEHATAHNLVGCLLTLAKVGANLAGTVHWAVNSRAHGVLRELLRMNADADGASKGWAGCTPLMLAAGHGDIHAMRILLTHFNAIGRGAMVKSVGNRQAQRPCYTALHFCAESGFDNCIELLLSCGSLVGAVSSGGATPLQLARKRLESTKGKDERQPVQRCCALLEAATAAAASAPQPSPSPAAAAGAAASRKRPLEQHHAAAAAHGQRPACAMRTSPAPPQQTHYAAQQTHYAAQQTHYAQQYPSQQPQYVQQQPQYVQQPAQYAPQQPQYVQQQQSQYAHPAGSSLAAPRAPVPPLRAGANGVAVATGATGAPSPVGPEPSVISHPEPTCMPEVDSLDFGGGLLQENEQPLGDLDSWWLEQSDGVATR